MWPCADVSMYRCGGVSVHRCMYAYMYFGICASTQLCIYHDGVRQVSQLDPPVSRPLPRWCPCCLYVGSAPAGGQAMAHGHGLGFPCPDLCLGCDPAPLVSGVCPSMAPRWCRDRCVLRVLVCVCGRSHGRRPEGENSVSPRIGTRVMVRGCALIHVFRRHQHPIGPPRRALSPSLLITRRVVV